MRGLKLPSRRTALLSGGVVALLGGITAVTARVVKQRYVTGEAEVKQLVDTGDDGLLVVLTDGKVFWAPESLRGVLKTYEGDGAQPLSYRIDQFRRNRSGLPVGRVNVEG